MSPQAKNIYVTNDVTATFRSGGDPEEAIREAVNLVQTYMPMGGGRVLFYIGSISMVVGKDDTADGMIESYYKAIGGRPEDKWIDSLPDYNAVMVHAMRTLCPAHDIDTTVEHGPGGLPVYNIAIPGVHVYGFGDKLVPCDTVSCSSSKALEVLWGRLTDSRGIVLQLGERSFDVVWNAQYGVWVVESTEKAQPYHDQSVGSIALTVLAQIRRLIPLAQLIRPDEGWMVEMPGVSITHREEVGRAFCHPTIEEAVTNTWRMLADQHTRINSGDGIGRNRMIVTWDSSLQSWVIAS